MRAGRRQQQKQAPTESAARTADSGRWRVGVLVFAGSLAVRLIYLFESAENPTFDAPILDAGTYHRMASALASGRAIDKDFFWQPVFYPSFLTVVYWITGSSTLVAKILQMALGAFTCVLVWRLGARLFDERTGLVAAAIAALHGPAIHFEGELLGTGWESFWAVSLLLLLLGNTRRPTLLGLLLLGVAGGLAVLTRPNFLPFFLVASGWMAVTGLRSCEQRTTWSKGSIALLLGFVLPLIPVALKQQQVTHHFGLLPQSSWLNVYLGNNPDTCSTLTLRPGERWDQLNLKGRSQSGSETGEWFRDQTLQYVRESPVALVAGLGQKSLQFVSSRELPRNTDTYLFREWSGVLSVLVWKLGKFGFPFGLLAPLAVLGAVMGREHLAAPVGWFLLLYPLSFVLVFVSDRYRLPVTTVLAVLAAAGAIGLARVFRERHIKPLLAWMTLLVSVVVLTSVGGPYCQEQTPFASEMQRSIGNWWLEEHQPRKALQFLARAIETDPNNFEAHNDMSLAYADLDEPEPSARAASLALKIRPDSATATTNLANALAGLGQYELSLELYQRVLELNPAFPGYHANVGSAFLNLKRPEDAVKPFELELLHHPDDVETHYRLAIALEETGHEPRAISHYRNVLQLQPSHEGAARALRRLSVSQH